MREIMTRIFYPLLKPIFQRIDVFLSTDFMDNMATICALGLFICTMIWVGVIIRERYVNRGRPNDSIWTDLRLWTVISMLPHVFVYLYFR